MEIRKFDPAEAKPHRMWLLIGPRGSGKSVLLLDLLSKTGSKARFDYGAFTQTLSTAENLERYFPARFVHKDGYDYEIADSLLEDAKHASKVNKSALLVLDDCMFDSGVMKSQIQKTLALNGRHFLATCFNTTQYAMCIPPIIRGNIDYVIALRDTTIANRKRLYDHYFGVYKTLAEFERVFSAVTADHGALVLDKTASSGKIEDQIKWYRAPRRSKPARIFRRGFLSAASQLDKLNGAQEQTWRIFQHPKKNDKDGKKGVKEKKKGTRAVVEGRHADHKAAEQQIVLVD